jgi:hypothetical protein
MTSHPFNRRACIELCGFGLDLAAAAIFCLIIVKIMDASMLVTNLMQLQFIAELGGEAGTHAFQAGACDGGCLAEERSKPVFVMAKF